MPASIAGAAPTGPQPVGAAPSAPLAARLRRTATRFAATDAAAGLVLAAAAAVGLWTLACAAEALLWLPSFGRVLLDVLVAVPVGWIVAARVARPLLQRAGVFPGLSDTDTARRVGGLLPGVGERIGAALDLVAGRLSGTSTGLAAAAARALEGDLAPVPFERAARFDAAARHARRLWPVLLAAALAVAAAPGPMTGASARLLSPLTHATRPAPFALTVAPGDVTLAAGDTLVVRVDVAGRVRPSEVVLELRRDGEAEVESRRLAPDAAGRYEARVPDVRAGLRYRIVALPVESAWHRVTVVARPSMSGLQVTVTPPAYARQAAQTLADGTGDVAGLPGTRVAVAVRLDGSAREAFLVFDDGSRLTLAVRGAAASGAFTLRREGMYRVVVRGPAVGGGAVGAVSGAGAETAGPDFRMTVLPDAPPSVAIVAPGPDAPFTGRADLDVRAADDYGLARAVLFWRPLRLTGSAAGDSAAAAIGGFRSVGLPLPAGRRLDEALRHAFAPRVGPGEGAEYYVQVWDNNAAGAQTARTPVYRLRRAGADEALRALDTAQAGQDEALEQTEEAAERLRLQSDEMREALREGGDAARRAADSLAARQRQFEQQAERLATDARDVAAEMQRQNASPESQQAQRQMQRTLEELNDPDLRRALEEMQRALEQNDTPRAQQAYERYEQRAQDLRERLEQARALVERFRLQQQIESAAQQAAALEERQRDLAEEARRVEEQMQPRENETAAEREAREEQAQQAADDLARQQQAAAEEARRFEEQLREMQEQGQRTPGAPRQQMQEVQERAERNAASRPMEEAGERLDRAGETPPQEPGEQGEQQQSQQGQPPQQGQPQQGQQTPPPQQQRPPQSTPGQSQQSQGAQSPQQQPQSAQQRQMQQAQAEQQEAQRQLEWYRRQLQQMGEQMQSQKESVNAAAVRKALDDVLRLSTQQEALRLRTQRSESGSSPVLRDAAGRQADLAAGLRTVADTLGRIARRAPIVSRAVQEDVGEALREMTAAQQRLTQRQAAPAAAGQRAAMTHLNELALKLTQMLDNALSGSPSGGQSGQQSLQQMLQQLQQMSGEQQSLNEQTQQMLNDQAGERLRPDAAGQAQRMARQQAELRRELRQMSRNPESRGRMLDELEEAEQQMDEVRRELERGRVSRPMQERQRQILSRLLEATRSLQQRGEDDRREGRRPGAVDADGPRAAPPPPTPDEQLRRDLLRALDADYTPETERLIRRYLERLRTGG